MQCQEETRRGGFSAGGGYDRMNFTRYEPCGKPTTIGNVCTWHSNLRAKKRAEMEGRIADRQRVLAFHDEGAHVGGEMQWARRCAKCASSV